MKFFFYSSQYFSSTKIEPLQHIFIMYFAPEQEVTQNGKKPTTIKR